MPFTDETLASLRTKIASLANDNAAPNRLFYDGDHWGSGEYWIGPRPEIGNTNYASVMLEIQRAFISKNAIREAIARHMQAIIGREPAWRMTVARPLGRVEAPDGTMQDEAPNEAEQALIDEAETALTVWWDKRGALGVLQDMCATLLLEARGALRLYVPPGKLETVTADGVTTQGIRRADLSAALDAIYLHHPKPNSAAVVTETKTQAQAGIYLYQEDADAQADAAWETERNDRAELVAVEGGATLIRILNGEEGKPVALPLGGRLTIYEAARDVLISPQVRQLQMLLNLSLTMLGRNVVMGGFLERVILNAQMPGDYQTNSEGRRVFVPDKVYYGAGTTNILNGAPIYDQAGNVTGYANPSVQRFGPVEVSTFLQTKEEAYRAILEEVNQLHALIAGDATASGESRKQARADFAASLNDTTTQLARAGRWLLETVLSMAAVFSGQPGRYDGLRAVFDPRIDMGPQSSEDVTQIQALTGGQALLSVETAMSRLGVEDVDAEAERLAAEATERAARAPAVVVQPSQDTPPMGDGQDVNT